MRSKGKSITFFIASIAVIALMLYTAFWGLKVDKLVIHSALDKENGIRRGLDLTGGSIIIYEAQLDGVPTDEEMSTVVSMLQDRATRLGYTEATITRQGDKRVRVEIPSIANPEDAVRQLGSTAHLTFVDMDDNVLIDGKNVKDARYVFGPLEPNGPSVSHVVLEFDEVGTEAFTAATTYLSGLKNEGKNFMAIKLDEEVKSAPQVREPIASSSATISGQFDAKSAGFLADIIRAGKLPFNLKDVELRGVGPTLGEKAFSSSLIAGAIGICLVLLFMLMFYRLLGVIADISLIAYIAIVVLIMGGFRINLSLPGIAGIILSIGMAVDANVVIYERIREELKIGKSIGSSINAGFKKAFTAILDGNLTTLIAAGVLWYFGTGPIQGFAVTLTVGILASMFTAIVVTKWLLLLLVGMNIKNPKLYIRVGGGNNV